MDDIVRQAMAKWPNVPHCYGWLGLDERGNWYMRDDRVQAAGPFPQAKGSVALQRSEEADRLHPPQLRTMTSTASGSSRTGRSASYVELQRRPGSGAWTLPVPVASHTGAAAQVRASFVDESGRLYLETDRGFGLVHTQDIVQASEWVESGHWQPREVRAADLPARFGYLMSPARQRAHAPGA